ncbi:MAG TPA: hypothetical protein PLW35_13645 [Verrucomicrobiota bacterium]|nr:hypothetical protein [Verrucomicrobiota bacterium]
MVEHFQTTSVQLNSGQIGRNWKAESQSKLRAQIECEKLDRFKKARGSNDAQRQYDTRRDAAGEQSDEPLFHITIAAHLACAWQEKRVPADRRFANARQLKSRRCTDVLCKPHENLPPKGETLAAVGAATPNVPNNASLLELFSVLQSVFS